MDPINNTFSDQLMKFVANEMKEEMERKQRRADYSDVLIIFAPLIFFMIIALLAMIIPYLWNWWISGRSGPSTRYPIVPFDLSDLKLYTGMKSTGNQTPEAKIQVSYVSEHLENKANTLNAILRMVFNIKDKKARLVPYATKTISIKMDGFKHGPKCHDFEPIDGEFIGSCYKYKMYGKNRIQVTYYVIGGKSYVAGFCLYVDYSAKDIDFNKNVVKKLIKSAKYPGRKHLEEESGKEAKCVGVGSAILKYCPGIQRIVMTEVESGVVKHQEWDKYEQKMMSEKCEMCTEKWRKQMPPTYSSLSISIV
ncbi:unnamed protein product [Caenorhabditis brenneri]